MVHRGSLSRLARLLACLLASSSLIARARAEDFYKILGVDRGADARTLKKNYRIKALKHHPDKGGDPETFAKLSRAYETLTDPCLLYTSPSPRDRSLSRMPSSA